MHERRVAFVDNRVNNQKPDRGVLVDSISYYTHDLADLNKVMYALQQRKADIAVSGNTSFEADNWFSRLMVSAYEVADQIMIDSAEDNELRATYSSFDESVGAIPQAELMTSHYGSFGPIGGMSPRTAQCRPYSSHPRNFLRARRLEKLIVVEEGEESGRQHSNAEQHDSNSLPRPEDVSVRCHDEPFCASQQI